MRTDIETIEAITLAAENRGVNLCGSFDDWTNTCMAIASVGEAGRPYFHRLAAMDDKYKESENDKKFTNCMRTVRNVTVGTLVKLAEDAGIRLSNESFTLQPTSYKPQRKVAEKQREIDYLSSEEWEKHLSYDNSFFDYLCKIFSRSEAEFLSDLFLLGSTADRCAIFWQIDEASKVREGKIMRYGDDGHKVEVFQNCKVWWYSNQLKRDKLLADSWQREQCLFGLHRINWIQNKQRIIAIVEGEKTAIIASGLLPDYCWLATGGCGGLTAEKCRPLQGRKVILFPDVGQYDKWRNLMPTLGIKDVAISDVLENKGFPNNYDVADFFVAEQRK